MMDYDPADLISKVTVEPMTFRDLEQVTAIERKCFHRPWKPGGFRTELQRKPSRCLVVRQGWSVLGYIIFWLLPPEIHILNIAVHPSVQRRGLAGLLLDYTAEYGRETGVEEIFLEVRAGNRAAQALYRSRGFRQVGVRKNYYAQDQEDALVMTLGL
jgi:ribosomal-protein-alanine N-acetyltransferase